MTIEIESAANRPSIWKTYRAHWIWLSLCLAMIVFRMFVVSDDDIHPIIYDSSAYAFNAIHYVENSTVADIPPHRPGLAITAWFAGMLGIPYKLYLDGLLFAIALSSGALLVRYSGSWLAGLLVVFGLLFNAWFIVHSVFFMTEPLIATILVATFFSSLHLICRPIAEWSFGSAFLTSGFCIAWVATRNELMLLICFQVLLAGVIWLRRGRSFSLAKLLNGRSRWKLLFLVLPVAAAWMSIYSIQKVNQKRYGVRATCLIELDGYLELLDALYSVVPEEKIRFAPVTRQSIGAACDASPTLGKYKTSLTDKNRFHYKLMSRVRPELEDEFGTWLNWLLMDCIPGPIPEKNETMRQAAVEIREAQARGDLPKRIAKFPIEPNLNFWIPDLPNQFCDSLLRCTISPNLRPANQMRDQFVESAVEWSYFEEGVMLRSGAGNDRTLRMFGRRSSEPFISSAVQVLTERGGVLDTRPLWKDQNGFNYYSISLDQYEAKQVRGAVAVRLIAHHPGQPVRFSESVPVPKLSKRFSRCDFVFPATEDQPEFTEIWNVASRKFRKPAGNRAKIRTFLKVKHRQITYTLWGLALVCGVLVGANADQRKNLWWIGLTALCFMLGRCFLYSLIHAWLWWGLGRYVEPNGLLIILSVTCLAFALGTTIRAAIFQRRTVPA